MELETALSEGEVLLVVGEHVDELTLLELLVLSILVQEVFGHLGEVHDLVHEVILLTTVTLHTYNQLLSGLNVILINTYP